MVDAYFTPEEAALSSYSPAARAFVVRTEVLSDERTDVVVDTHPSHPMRVHCFRAANGWVAAGDIVE